MKIKRKEQPKRVWTKANIDVQLRSLVEQRKVSPVAWWLMASYAYYELNQSLLQDETFDWLGRYIKDNWEGIEHPNKRLIKQAATFSGYYVKRYPTRVKAATWQLIDELENQNGRPKLKIRRKSQSS